MKAMKISTTAATATITTTTTSPRTNGIISIPFLNRNHSFLFPRTKPNYSPFILSSSFRFSSLSILLRCDLPGRCLEAIIAILCFLVSLGRISCNMILPMLFLSCSCLEIVVPVGCSVGNINQVANKHTTAADLPNHRNREAESILVQQKRLMSVNNYLSRDKAAGQSGSVLNPNPVSTGLRLSYEEEEHNSSVTCAAENMKAGLPVISSLYDNLKIEIDRQKNEFDQYIKLQEEKILKGVTELIQRQTVSFLNTIEKGVSRKLQEKEIEIENMNRKNKELMERIKQITTEVQSWHYKAKYNESVVNFLRNNLQQVIAQSVAHVREGCGDSEVDDAASYTNMNHLGIVNGSGNLVFTKKQVNCRACMVKEVSVLLLPCKHLCLCKDCEGFIDVCPVCRQMKNASLQVHMS